jgi:hypothetical protein
VGSDGQVIDILTRILQANLSGQTVSQDIVDDATRLLGRITDIQSGVAIISMLPSIIVGNIQSATGPINIGSGLVTIGSGTINIGSSIAGFLPVSIVSSPNLSIASGFVTVGSGTINIGSSVAGYLPVSLVSSNVTVNTAGAAIISAFMSTFLVSTGVQRILDSANYAYFILTPSLSTTGVIQYGYTSAQATGGGVPNLFGDVYNNNTWRGQVYAVLTGLSGGVVMDVATQ